MADLATGLVQPQGLGPGDKTTDTVLRLHVNNVVQTLTSSEKSVEPSTRSVTTVADWDTSQRCVDKIQII